MEIPFPFNCHRQFLTLDSERKKLAVYECFRKVNRFHTDTPGEFWVLRTATPYNAPGTTLVLLSELRSCVKVEGAVLGSRP